MPRFEKSDVVYGLLVAIILLLGYGLLDTLIQFADLIFHTIGLL